MTETMISHMNVEKECTQWVSSTLRTCTIYLIELCALNLVVPYLACSNFTILTNLDLKNDMQQLAFTFRA